MNEELNYIITDFDVEVKDLDKLFAENKNHAFVSRNSELKRKSAFDVMNKEVGIYVIQSDGKIRLAK